MLHLAFKPSLEEPITPLSVHDLISPRMDTKGKVKCSRKGENNASEDHFTKEDFALFMRTGAGAWGLDVTTEVASARRQHYIGFCHTVHFQP
jgi:hypothetical protein